MTNHIKIYGVKPRIQYVANGNLKKYEFPFVIFKTSDVDVYLDDKLLTTSEYEVSVAPDIEGGTISFKVAPSNGTVITIARNLSIERTTDFQEGGALRANVLNDELDYQIACQQQIADSLNRSMVLPPYAVDTDVDLTLPTPSAGKAIVWNSEGTNLENSNVEVNALESTLRSYKESAESSATIATQKAEIASNKADIATTKAQIATDKASEAVATLGNKANKDMDNLSDTGKQTIISLSMPDFSSGVSKTNDIIYQAECDGWLCIYGSGTASASAFSLNFSYSSDMSNATEVAASWVHASGFTSSAFIPVTKGVFYRANDISSGFRMTFFPCKGV